LRAYLGIASAELDSGLKLGEPVTVTLQFKNFGQTPAYKCVASMNCAHLDFGDEVIDFPFDLDPELVGTIHPGEPLFKSRIGPPLSAEDLAAIRGRKKAIWLFGTFTYEVAFDMPPRKTQFLYFLTALENGQITSKNLGICEYGNTAD
jgi:hypothetical protein